MSKEKPRQNHIENSQEFGSRSDKQLEPPKIDDGARERAREAAKKEYNEKKLGSN